MADLGRPVPETIGGELMSLINEIEEAERHVEEWAKPVNVKTSEMWQFSQPQVTPQPKGGSSPR